MNVLESAFGFVYYYYCYYLEYTPVKILHAYVLDVSAKKNSATSFRVCAKRTGTFIICSS